MLLKTTSSLQLWILLLSLYFIILQTYAANISTQKNQQQTQVQQSPVQPQQQTHQSVHQQVVQQQHHQQQQQQQQAHLQQVQHVQYVHERDPMQDIIKHANNEEDLTDTYQFLNELKHDSPPRLPAQAFPWNPYTILQHNPPPQIPPANINNHQSYSPFEGFPSFTAAPHTPKYLPFISYPQPVFIPYPFYIAPPEMFYSTFPGGSSSTTAPTSTNDMEDTMSRAANGRRPSTSSQPNGAYSRNSPIYYVRLPPMPYMFIPGLGYTPPTSANAFNTGLPSMLPFQTHTLPTFSPFSSIFNVPMNFLANGKPSNIYQIGSSPNDIQSSVQFVDTNGFTPHGPPPPPPPFQSVSNPYRPMSSPSYIPHPSYGISAPPPPYQDSKMTTLKRPFVFNGRPEDIFILPNNFNPLYSNSGYY